MAYDLEFEPARLDGSFKQWVRRGTTYFCNRTPNREFQRYEVISDTFELGKQDFHRYLQVRDYYNKKVQVKEEKEYNLISIFHDATKDNKKLVSRIYGSIQVSKNHSTLSIKQKWEREKRSGWNYVRQKRPLQTQDHREFGWKNVVRFFITPKIQHYK